MKFRKKPIEIEAIGIAEIIEAERNAETSHFPSWLLIALRSGTVLVYLGHHPHIEVRTLENLNGERFHGRPKDWLVKGVKGELYVVRNDIFVETYDLVTP